jgi:hypothetical protein
MVDILYQYFHDKAAENNYIRGAALFACFRKMRVVHVSNTFAIFLPFGSDLWVMVSFEGLQSVGGVRLTL